MSNQALMFLEEITKWVDDGSPVDVVYSDFQIIGQDARPLPIICINPPTVQFDLRTIHVAKLLFNIYFTRLQFN